jgi:hypothetical protein
MLSQFILNFSDGDYAQLIGCSIENKKKSLGTLDIVAFH